MNHLADTSVYFVGSQLKGQIQEQDQHLDLLHTTLQQVRHQTSALNHELREHNVLLGQLGGRMDETEERLTSARRRVQVLYEELTDRQFTWTAMALILVLSILLILLIFY